jgi:hypothetical protein
MTDPACPTTASRALELPEILEAVLEHAYAVSKDIREFSRCKFVNRLWLHHAEALQVATVYIEAGDVVAFLPHSQNTLLGVTPLLERKPELYLRICEIELYSSLQHARRAITGSLAAGLRAAATSARLRSLCLRWETLDHWRMWQDHLSPLAINLEHLELTFTNYAYSSDENLAFCDLISRATRLRSLELFYRSIINCDSFGSILTNAGANLETLHIYVDSVQSPSKTWQAIFAESGIDRRQIKSLTLEIRFREDDNINAFLPHSLQRITVFTSESPLQHFLRALADPAFLPSLTSTPSLSRMPNWGARSRITRNEVKQAIRALRKRKRIVDLEQERHILFDLVEEEEEEYTSEGSEA